MMMTRAEIDVMLHRLHLEECCENKLAAALLQDRPKEVLDSLARRRQQHIETAKKLREILRAQSVVMADRLLKTTRMAQTWSVTK